MWCRPTSRVSLGTSFAPLVYKLIMQSVKLAKFVLFADDTNIFCSNEHVEALQDTLNRELAKLLYGSRLINYL